MTMPLRIPDHIDRTDYEALADWLESDEFDPGPEDWRDAAPLRAVREAAENVEHAETELATAVAAARDAGFSWRTIAVFLGVSHQAARKRFGTPAHA
jgi:hypothetical protein